MLNHNKIFSKNKIALREIEGNSEEWIERIRVWLIEFLKKKMQISTVTTYCKMLFR